MISTLSCMRDIIKNDVAELLSKVAEPWLLLSTAYFGNRTEWSAIDIAAIVVHRVH